MSAHGLVRLTRVTKAYRRGSVTIPVLCDVDLVIAQGSFVAVMGPSGVGKSTLLNLIAGLDRPDRGSIAIDGLELTRLPESALARWRARHVGFVFQFYNLIPVLTALENVDLPQRLAGGTSRARKARSRQALADVGLADRADHYPSQLSGGEQQRVAIARAIVNNPTLIVADEPTGDLDDASAHDILALLARMNHVAGKTVLMVTHDPRAALCAEVIVHLDKAHHGVVASGPTAPGAERADVLAAVDARGVAVAG